jgi:hypothetical protein
MSSRTEVTTPDEMHEGQRGSGVAAAPSTSLREVEQAWLKLFAENLSSVRGPRGQLDALLELHRLTINSQIWPLATGRGCGAAEALP